MSFPVITDPYGLADGTTIAITGYNENKSASLLEKTGQCGAIAFSMVYGETSAPSCDGKVITDFSWTEGQHSFGDVTESDSKKFGLEQFVIKTAAGAEPTLSWSGKQLHATAATKNKFKIPAFSLSGDYCAQILFSAFTITEAAGIFLAAADYTCKANLGPKTKDGDIIGFDVTEGKIEAALTITSTDGSLPVLTAGTGWIIQQPLTKARTDSDVAEYTCTLSLALAKTVPA